jgi:hypothetical protein
LDIFQRSLITKGAFSGHKLKITNFKSQISSKSQSPKFKIPNKTMLEGLAAIKLGSCHRQSATWHPSPSAYQLVGFV